LALNRPWPGIKEKNIEHWSSPNGCHPDCPECERENLRSINADLLAALKDAVTALQYHLHFGDPAITVGLAVIAKAEGKE